MELSLEDVAELCNGRAPIDDHPACLAELDRLFRPAKPLLVLVADARGMLLAADDFGSEIEATHARELARESVFHLEHASSWCSRRGVVPGSPLAVCVRLPERTGGAILAALVESLLPSPVSGEGSLVALGPLHESTAEMLACAGSLVWEVLSMTGNQARLRAEAQHLQAERTMLKLSHARALADALEEREERLREQGEHTARLHAVMMTAADGIITLDEEGRIESFNEAAARIFGYACDEVLGQSVALLLPAEAASWQRDHDVSRFARETTGRRKNGEVFPLDLSMSAVVLGEKRIGTAIVRDITQRKLAEAHLRHAQKLESIGQLAAGIAHEINTPTQFIGDNTRFLKDATGDIGLLLEKFQTLLQEVNRGRADRALASEISDLLDRIDLPYLLTEIPAAIEQSLEGVERVAGIVRSMKEFSHPGGEEKQTIDLNRAIENTLTVSRNEWKYVAELVTDLDPNLPPVTCLPSDLNQVILNLVVNAAHAINDVVGGAGAKGKITVSTKQDGNFVEIRVADTGTGIPEAVRDKVFDPFFTTKEVGRGTGQGLAIAHNAICEKHGGTIGFATQIGCGTTFVIRLPIR